MDLENTKNKIRALVQTNLGDAIKCLEKEIDFGSEQYDNIIQLKAQFHDLSRHKQLNLIDFEKAEIATNNIRDRLLLLLSKLTSKDLHIYYLSSIQPLEEIESDELIEFQKKRIGAANKEINRLQWDLEQEIIKNDSLCDENSALRDEIEGIKRKLEFFQNADSFYTDCYACKGKGYVRGKDGMGQLQDIYCAKCKGNGKIKVFELKG